MFFIPTIKQQATNDPRFLIQGFEEREYKKHTHLNWTLPNIKRYLGAVYEN